VEYRCSSGWTASGAVVVVVVAADVDFDNAIVG